MIVFGGMLAMIFTCAFESAFDFAMLANADAVVEVHPVRATMQPMARIVRIAKVWFFIIWLCCRKEGALAFPWSSCWLGK